MVHAGFRACPRWAKGAVLAPRPRPRQACGGRAPVIRLEVMCNRYGYNSPLHRLVEIFEQIDLPFHWPEARPNLAPTEEIRPTDPAPVVRAYEDGVRLDTLRWG